MLNYAGKVDEAGNIQQHLTILSRLAGQLTVAILRLDSIQTAVDYVN